MNFNKTMTLLLCVLIAAYFVNAAVQAELARPPAEQTVDLEAQPPLPWVIEFPDSEDWRVVVVDSTQVAGAQWATIYLEYQLNDGNWYWADGTRIEMGEFEVVAGTDNASSFQNSVQQTYTLNVKRQWTFDLQSDIIVTDPNSNTKAGFVPPQ